MTDLSYLAPRLRKHVAAGAWLDALDELSAGRVIRRAQADWLGTSDRRGRRAGTLGDWLDGLGAPAGHWYRRLAWLHEEVRAGRMRVTRDGPLRSS